jgi:hypothetical protein
MDPLGFGLENYDAIGQWRTKDGEFPIETGGILPNGKDFVTPAQMKAILKQDMQEFARALTEKMMTYALGRGTENYDRPVIRDVVAKMEQNQYRFQTLVEAIVESLPFQARRGEAREVASK